MCLQPGTTGRPSSTCQEQVGTLALSHRTPSKLTNQSPNQSVFSQQLARPSTCLEQVGHLVEAGDDLERVHRIYRLVHSAARMVDRTRTAERSATISSRSPGSVRPCTATFCWLPAAPPTEDAAPPTANAAPTMDRYSGGAPKAGVACKLLHCREEGSCRTGGKGRGEGVWYEWAGKWAASRAYMGACTQARRRLLPNPAWRIQPCSSGTRGRPGPPPLLTLNW